MKLKIKLLILGLLVVVFIITSGFLGMYMGWKNAMKAEYIVHYFNYKDASGNLQLREFLKSRMYFLACGLTKRDLEGYNVDLGPVDMDKLKGISGIKGPESEEENYYCAITKHRK